jgi:hypothetical protein
MRSPDLLGTKLRFAFAMAFAATLILSACSMNVKKDGEQDKRVDIETPIGGLHVGKNADVRDIGLPVYPGARVKQKEKEGEEKSANVNISSSLFGLKVVAIEYESDDSPEKLISYYKDQLKKFGNVLECHTTKHGGGVKMDMGKNSEHHRSKDLNCEGDNSGRTVELKVGTEDNQHIVAVSPEGKGSSFALVYVRARGEDTI